MHLGTDTVHYAWDRGLAPALELDGSAAVEIRLGEHVRLGRGRRAAAVHEHDLELRHRLARQAALGHACRHADDDEQMQQEGDDERELEAGLQIRPRKRSTPILEHAGHGPHTRERDSFGDLGHDGIVSNSFRPVTQKACQTVACDKFLDRVAGFCNARGGSLSTVPRARACSQAESIMRARA